MFIHVPLYRTFSTRDPEAIKTFVERLNSLGFPVKIHAYSFGYRDKQNVDVISERVHVSYSKHFTHLAGSDPAGEQNA